MIRLPQFVVVIVLYLLTAPVFAAGPTYTDPDKADADFAVQGEYSGEFETDGGEEKFGVQIVALGDGKFRAVGYHGGLPGDGYNGEEPVRVEGEIKDGLLRLESDHGVGVVKDGVLTFTLADGKQAGQLKRVVRKSPTLGKKPPEGAAVLFDGSSADKFHGAKMTDDGLLMAGATSKQKFGDHKLHIEFLLPYQPHDREQARGNSGIYLQGRYEVQMLDSFGLAGEHNECGGIYEVKKPDVNMCLSPLSWQTYDIDFTAARYDADGKLTANPRITVRHNGIVIHDDVELPGDRSTRAAPVNPGPDPGPVYLQDHGNPVRYRNIWVVETK